MQDVMRGGRRRAGVWICAALLMGCAGARTGGDAPVGDWDRAAERTAVYEAVLRRMWMGERVTQLVIDPSVMGGAAEAYPYPLRMPGLRADTRRDYARVSASPTALPKDIDVGIPINWYTHAEFKKALDEAEKQESGLPLEDAWEQLRERYPGWSGWISFSDIGFSRDGRQALLDAGSGSAGLSAAYYLVLLEKRAGRWVVVKIKETAIA